MSLNPWMAAGGGLVVVLSLWFADHSAQVTKLALEQNTELKKDVGAIAAHSNVLAKALHDQAALRTVLGEISRQTRQTQSTLDGQTAQLNRDLAELKRNDKEVSSYLAGLVPAAVGLRYARPETTDPVAYRAGAAASLRAGAVSPAGSPGTGQ